MGSVSAGLASSAGVVYVPRPRRDGRLMPAELVPAEEVAPGSSGSGEPGMAAVLAAPRLLQHPALQAHVAAGGSGLGRYVAHVPLQAVTVLQGAEGLRGAACARGFALQQPVLLLAEGAAVLFSGGGLEAVLVLPLASTGGWGTTLAELRWTTPAACMCRPPPAPLAPACCRIRGALLEPGAAAVLSCGSASRPARRGGAGGGAVPAEPRRVAACCAAAAVGGSGDAVMHCDLHSTLLPVVS